MTKISVCLASYNGEKHIARQLESVLCQLSDNDEVIVSDDYSSDNTERQVRSFQDKRITFIKNSGEKGPIGNFQNALQKATGDIIFLCDQDDIWLPQKVHTMIALLKTHDLIISDCTVTDENLKVVYPSFFAVRKSRPGFVRNLYKNAFMGCCMAFRREVLSYVLPFPQGIHMHDWWIGLSVELNGKVKFHPEPLILYVRHGANVSPTSEGSLGWRQRILNRLAFLKALSQRFIFQRNI